MALVNSKIAYFPGEVKIKMRTSYNYVYKINCKIVKEGTCKGSELEKIPQFKHHNPSEWKEFEFQVA